MKMKVYRNLFILVLKVKAECKTSCSLVFTQNYFSQWKGLCRGNMSLTSLQILLHSKRSALFQITKMSNSLSSINTNH